MYILEKLKSLSDLEIDILEESKKSFMGKGFHNTNLDEIAKTLDIGKGTIYRHFESKISLFLFSVIYVINKEVSIVTKQESKTFRSSLDDYIDSMINISLKAGKFIRDIMSGDVIFLLKQELSKGERNDFFIQYMIDLKEKATTAFSDILEQGINEGHINLNCNLKIVSEIIFVLINNYLHMSNKLNLSLVNHNKKSDFFTQEEKIKELKSFIYRAININ